MCNSLQNLLSDDVERIAQLLLSLELLVEEEECDVYHEGEDVEVSAIPMYAHISVELFRKDTGSPCSMNIGPENQSSASYHERPPHRQHSHPVSMPVIFICINMALNAFELETIRKHLL